MDRLCVWRDADPWSWRMILRESWYRRPTANRLATSCDRRTRTRGGWRLRPVRRCRLNRWWIESWEHLCRSTSRILRRECCGSEDGKVWFDVLERVWWISGVILKSRGLIWLLGRWYWRGLGGSLMSTALFYPLRVDSRNYSIWVMDLSMKDLLYLGWTLLVYISL